MADGSFATKISKDRSDNAATNPVFVQLADGTDSALIDGSGNLQVILAANDGVDIGDVDVTSVVPGVGATNLGKAEDAVAADGDTGVMILSVRRDTAASSSGTDGDYSTLNTNSTGDLYVTLDGESITTSSGDTIADHSAFTLTTDKVFPMGALADETTPGSVDEGDVGIPRMTLDRKLIIEVADATTDGQRLGVNASGQALVESHQTTHDDLNANANIQVGDADVSSSNPVPVSKDGSANAETNPIFVQVVSGATSGNEIHDYNTASAVAADTADNHDYTVAGTTFFLKSVIWSGSGNVKAEIQTGPVASLATVATGFLTGRNGDTQQVFFDPPVEVPSTSTGTVRVIRTNRQGSATDVYSTIIGFDV